MEDPRCTDSLGQRGIILDFRIGDTVFVNSLSDETGLPKYLDQTGQIVYFNYDCGCGQSYPNDPMIGIIFSDGEIEEYWKEEIVMA